MTEVERKVKAGENDVTREGKRGERVEGGRGRQGRQRGMEEETDQRWLH